MVSIVDEAGRVEIPRELREKLGLMPGTPVSVEVHGSALSVQATEPKTGFGKPASNEQTRLVEFNGRLIVEGKWVGTDDDALNFVKKMREERDRKVMGI